MEATEIRAMSADELQEALETARENLFNLRFQWATGQIRDHNVLRVARRDIARLETIQREREALTPVALAGEE
jgi:large subunit ribosomal protein L29